ncbi:AAA domain-containing protein [Dehalobacter sp. TBBPA1]|uniref:AAA domain-containing protein n=1 Tax=Dehalobacter sp. TBBPA1 TaxID=3235037 RepID=UPI0034A235D3
MIIGNRYELLERIGGSHISEVFTAKDLMKDLNVVAVKILTIANLGEEKNGISELFRRECNSLSKINHSNIISYIDSGIDNDKFYIVTEYFHSCNLFQYIKSKQLRVQDIYSIFIQMLEGIGEAHKNLIIHRDLKPTNILVDDNGDLKIIDFGISKIVGLTYDASLTLKDYMTASYASPEQLLRNVVKPESDLFSIGAIMAYVITGTEPPVEKEKLEAYLNSIKNYFGLEEVIRKLLELNPKQRPQSAFQVLRQIQKEFRKQTHEKSQIYVKLSNSTPRQLCEIGKISYALIEHAVKYVQADLNDCKIYKNKSNYYLIGNKIKYMCKLSDEQTSLIISKVHSLDDYTIYEHENNRGIKLGAIWKIVKPSDSINDSDDLIDLLEDVNDKEQVRQAKLKRESIANELVAKWDKYLDDELNLLNKRTKMSNYSGYDLDDTGYGINIYANDSNLNLQKNDPIQVTSKAGKPIAIGTLEDIQDNTLHVILNSDIDLEDISDRGVIGVDVIQVTTSLKRLKNATRALKIRDLVNPNLVGVINEPELVTTNNLRQDTINYFQNLDDAIKKAVNRALATKDIFLVQGPPGTGKTTFITELVCQVLQKEPKARILISSQSHVAVDHVLKGITKYIEGKLPIRLGRRERISIDSESLLIENQLRTWEKEVQNKSETGIENYLKEELGCSEQFINDFILELQLFRDKKYRTEDQQKNNIDIPFSDENDQKIRSIKRLSMEWHRRLGKSEEFNEIFADKASIVAATCLGIASRHVLNKVQYDWVIIDEAARATAPELLVPMIKGHKIVLVGDHHQLPPVVNLDFEVKKEEGLKASDLEKSLFEELIERVPSQAKTILNAQFRMHPSIAKLIFEVFYPTVKLDTKTLPENRKHHLNWWPKTLIWLNTENIQGNIEQEFGQSKRNKVEAQVILKTLENIETAYENNNQHISVSVISGYEAQKAQLKNLIDPHNTQKWKYANILIDNVDAFQGSETDIAIYSVVRSNKELRLGFLNDSRRLNVALSRGKTCLIIVGNIKFAERAKALGGNPFEAVIRYFRNNPNDCIVEDI